MYGLCCVVMNVTKKYFLVTFITMQHDLTPLLLVIAIHPVLKANHPS